MSATSGWWWRWLAKPESRCLVPVTSFSEYDHRTKPPTCTWFAQDETRPLFFFAGIWQPWSGTRGPKAAPDEGDHMLYSFLTSEPNAVAAPVHAKAMPVLLLTERDRETWLKAPPEAALPSSGQHQIALSGLWRPAERKTHDDAAIVQILEDDWCGAKPT